MYKKFKLKKISSIVSGSTAPKDNFFNNDNGIPFIRAGHLEELIEKDDLQELPKLMPNLEGQLKLKKVPANTILFAKSGMSSTKNRVYKCTQESYIVNHLAGIIPNEDMILSDFLMYFLIFYKPSRLIIDESYPSIRLQDIQEIEIDVPDISVQKSIIDILNKSRNLIAKRQVQITALDELTQSVFFEMFGDPLRNNVWKNILFEEVCESKLGKMLDKKNQEDLSQKYYIGNRHVQWGKFQLDELPLMGFKDNELKKYALKKGDILICEGGQVGRCAIWQWDDKEIYYQKALHRARVKNHLATPEFIQYVLYMYSINGGFKDFTSTATIAHLTAAKLNKLPIPLPPLELQQKFSSRYYSILNQKKIFEFGLIELENLYKSVLQKAFKGELF
ncbi:restriction endonuclease subunit S [Bacillus cereus]|uniref:restriction endonuclease subunit S n=1 Tax=Bacillus cereus TaxID=1396 RepID=UPI00217E7946|nr:restriction endonuclease subunit S [Bacillus cereus]MCS6596041.1 restriction endonuclease subunit S [Bacillus cereus]